MHMHTLPIKPFQMTLLVVILEFVARRHQCFTNILLNENILSYEVENEHGKVCDMFTQKVVITRLLLLVYTCTFVL